jgi:hypothetical protein
MKCKLCDKEASAKGFCGNHYRYQRTRTREIALKDLLTSLDALKTKRPDVGQYIDEATKEARLLFREFTPKKPSDANKIAMLEKEMAELRALLKPAGRTRSK